MSKGKRPQTPTLRMLELMQGLAVLVGGLFAMVGVGAMHSFSGAVLPALGTLVVWAALEGTKRNIRRDMVPKEPPRLG